LGGYLGFSAAFFAISVWLFSIDDDAQGKKASSVLWAMFWPLIWLYLRLNGKGSVHRGQRRALTQSAITNADDHGGEVEHARRFRTVREAKDYLASRISEEAGNEGVTLTEVERKMLYFTETGWTLPDMKAVSAEFDRAYDGDEYERKIGALVRKILAREDTDQGSWDNAVTSLSRGDHYLLVLIDAGQTKEKPAIPSLKVVAAALALLALTALDMWFRHWMRDH
jgi:hypothetical protein